MKAHYYRLRIILIAFLILSQVGAAFAAGPVISTSVSQMPCHMSMGMSSVDTSNHMMHTAVAQPEQNTAKGMDCCDSDHNGKVSCASDCRCTAATSFVSVVSGFDHTDAVFSQGDAFSDESQSTPKPFLSLPKRPPIPHYS